MAEEADWIDIEPEPECADNTYHAQSGGRHGRMAGQGYRG